MAVFVVGSMARGWSHDASDLDLVVVSDKPMVDERLLAINVPLIPDTIPVMGLQRAGRRWEIKFWSDSQVDQMLEKVSWETFEGDRKVGNRLTEVEQLFLERLGTCVPITGDDWVQRRREEVEDSAFRALVVLNDLALADTHAEAAMGLLTAGEAEGAVLAAREAFGHVVDALLTSEGEYGAMVKWRARRLRSAQPRLLSFDDYWSIETMRTYDPNNPAAWVEKVFRLCKDLASQIEV
jgi:predicted nucleotidyltransferase